MERCRWQRYFGHAVQHHELVYRDATDMVVFQEMTKQRWKSRGEEQLSVEDRSRRGDIARGLDWSGCAAFAQKPMSLEELMLTWISKRMTNGSGRKTVQTRFGTRMDHCNAAMFRRELQNMPCRSARQLIVASMIFQDGKGVLQDIMRKYQDVNFVDKQNLELET